VRPLLGPAQLEAGAPHDDVDLVGDVVADELVEAQRAGDPSTIASMLQPKVYCSWVCL
jgi:hypothetical protein